MSQYSVLKLIRRSVCTATLCAVWLIPQSGAAAGPTVDTTAVREKYDRAVSMFKAENYAEARRLLRETWEQRKTADIATLLGQTEAVLGNHAAAAKYLAYALANFPPTESMKRSDVIRSWLSDEQKHVGTLTLATKPEGTTVIVDGVVVGTTPLQTPLFLEAGSHVVTLQKDGFDATSLSLTLTAGASRSWSAGLSESKAQTPAPTAPKVTLPIQPVQQPAEPRLDVQPQNPKPWVLVTGGAVTAGALVTGLVFNLKANSAYSDARRMQGAESNDYCWGSASAGSYCRSLLDSSSDGDRFRNYSTVAFAVAGTAAIGTVAYWLWPRAKSHRTSQVVRINATISSQASALSVTSSF